MSSSISDRVRSLYSQYTADKIVPPTPKQIDLILKLGGNPNRSTTSIQALKQIRFLLGNQKITSKQQSLVRSLPKDRVDEILKRDVIIEEMTRFEISRVMNVLQNQHQLAPKVYNHPIISTSEYEYGWQESEKCRDNRMAYVVYYNLLMVDIDGALDLDRLQAQLLNMGLTGRLYRTYNGYHFFVTSRPIDHKSSEVRWVMEQLDCDVYYMAFAFLNGFKVRLNPKNREGETIAAEFVEIIGRVPEDPQLVSLLSLHDTYIERHKSEISP